MSLKKIRSLISETRDKLFQKHPKPMNGFAAQDLQNILGAKLVEMGYLFGASNHQWSEISSSSRLGGKYSILCRILLTRPELSPLVIAPNPSDLFDEIQSLVPEFTPAHFGFLLGLEALSGSRLLTNPKSSKAVEKITYIIKTQLDKCQTNDQKLKEIAFFMAIAETEALSRGIDLDTFWEKGGWDRERRIINREMTDLAKQIYSLVVPAFPDFDYKDLGKLIGAKMLVGLRFASKDFGNEEALENLKKIKATLENKHSKEEVIKFVTSLLNKKNA
jgi:hypothetical protein